MQPRNSKTGLPRVAAAAGAGFSLPPAVTTTCASISALGGATLTVVGICYPLYETNLTVKRLETIEKEVKEEQKEMHKLVQKIALKLKVDGSEFDS